MTTPNSLLSFATAEVKAGMRHRFNARDLIRNALRNDDCWNKLKPYLTEEIAGSKSFDHCIAALSIVEYDSLHAQG